MAFDLQQTGRMIDVSLVQTAVTMTQLDEMIEAAKKYRFIACFAMPCFTEYVAKALKDESDIKCCGVVGFPSGADLTAGKIKNAEDMLALGCEELDMVINVGALKSGMYNFVHDDIKAIVDTAGDVPVKAIIEQCYLTDDEICKASEIAVKAGVEYVKTGTGWGPKPTTTETIKLIKRTIGDSALIKAAGSVRNLDTMIAMYDEGCSRFGIGTTSAVKIMEEAKVRLNA